MQNRIEIVITSDSRGAITGIAKAGESVKTLQTHMTGLQASLGDVAKGLGVFYGIKEVIEGITGAVKASLQFLGQMETSALGIASAYMVGGKYIDEVTGKALEGEKALRAAQADSKQMLEELQVANLQTIATLDQLVRAYQETLPVAMAKGFDRQMAKDFTVAMVQAAGAIGLSLDQMGEETRSILTGSISPRTSRIATVLGLRNEDIKQYQGDAQRLFDFLMQKLDAYKIAGIESQKTWAGLWSNVKDIALQAGGKMFEPLFEAIKQELSDITSKIVTIDEKTKTIKWNDEFLSTIKEVQTAVSGLIDEVIRLGMFLDKVGGTLTGLGTSHLFAGDEGAPQWARLSSDEKKRLFGKPMEWNQMYEDRYKEKERALYTREVVRQGVLKPASSEKLEALAYTTPAGAGLVEMTTQSGQKLYFEPGSVSGKARYKANAPKPTTDQMDESRASVDAELKEKLALLREEETRKLESLRTESKARELSHKEGILSEKEYLSETNDLKRESIEWSIAYAQKEKDAISLAWEEKKGLYTEGKDRIKEEGRVKAELSRRDTEIAKGKEELARLGIDYAIKEIEYNKDLAEVKREGSLKVLEAEYSLKKKLIEIGVERGEMTQLEARQKELDLEERIQIVRIESLRAKYNEAEKDAEKLQILSEIAAQEQEVLATVAERARVEQQLTGSLADGLAEGLRTFSKETRTTFQQGVEIARQTAQGMEQAFSDFFFDAFRGKMQSLSDYLNAFLMSVQRALANALSQQITGGLLGGSGSEGGWLSSLLKIGVGFLSSSLTGSAGIPSNANYVPGIHHGGGTVRKFVPVFHGGGLNADERLVINRVGERYINKEQNDWLTHIARVAQGQPSTNVFIFETGPGVPALKARDMSSQRDSRGEVKRIMLELAVTDPAIRAALGIK